MGLVNALVFRALDGNTPTVKATLPPKPTSARTAMPATDELRHMLPPLLIGSNADDAMNMLNELVSTRECFIATLVDEARSAVHAERAARLAFTQRYAAEDVQALLRSRLRNLRIGRTERVECGSAPFCAQVVGHLSLVRQECDLKSAEVCRLEPNARVLVLDTRRTPDGTLRGAISLPGMQRRVKGWITLAAKDGSANVITLSCPTETSPDERAGSDTPGPASSEVGSKAPAQATPALQAEAQEAQGVCKASISAMACSVGADAVHRRFARGPGRWSAGGLMPAPQHVL